MLAVTDMVEAAGSIYDDMVELRRALHRHPEIGGQLPRTQAEVLNRLSALDGLEVTLGRSQTSITAVLRGQRPAPEGGPTPVVLLRGDMDALPVNEETGLAYASEVPGVMHACGHDLHTAALYGALRLLYARRDRLCGDVVFMFQPAEEDYDGARLMVEEGVLHAAGRPVDAAFGLHVVSDQYENGLFLSRPGTLAAGCEELRVTVRGEGGHGSQPHLAKDPVPVACEMVLALQTLVTRSFDVFDPIVATVGKLVSGTLGNIIPDTATFDVTLRVFSPSNRDKLVADVRRMCRGIADAHALAVSFEQPPSYPVTVNAPAEHEYVREVVSSTFGARSFQEMEVPMTGSEDFSHVLRQVPGAFMLLGACTADPATAPTNHSPRATFDEGVLPRAAAALAELAFRRG